MSISAKVKVWLVPVLIVLGAFIVFQYLKNTKPQTAPTEVTERAWQVEVLTLESKNWRPNHTLYGSVESTQQQKLLASLAAELSQLNVKAGDLFKQGDQLFAFNPQEIALYLTQSQADFAEAKASFQSEQQAQKTERKRLEQEQTLYQIRQADLKRNQELVQRNLASESSVDQARDALVRQELALINAQLVVEQQTAKLAQLQARLDRAKAQLERAELNAKRANYRAPFDGRVVETHVAVGDQLSANSLIMEVYPLQSLELRAKLPNRQRVQVERALTDNQPVQAWYSFADQRVALPLKRLDGRSTTSGLDAFFQVPTSLTHTRPGDLLRVQLELAEIADGFAVPYSALYGSNRVYLVEDERLVARQVEPVGEVDINGVRWVLISGNLQAGDQLNVTHLPNAISGLRVEPQAYNGKRDQR